MLVKVKFKPPISFNMHFGKNNVEEIKQLLLLCKR